MNGKGKGKGGAEEKKPPEPPKPAPPKSWMELLFAEQDKLTGMLGFAIKWAAAGELVLTEEGRGLVSEAFAWAGTMVQAAIVATEEMIRRKLKFLGFVSVIGLAMVVGSPLLRENRVRFLFEMSFLTIALVASYLMLVLTARWWFAQGFLSKSAEALKDENYKALLRGNPFPIVGAAAQQSVPAGLEQIYGLARQITRIDTHFAISALYLCQPFWQDWTGLIFAPAVIYGFVGLAFGYHEKKGELKGHHWFLYLFCLLGFLFVISGLAWNPWLRPLIMYGTIPHFTRGMLASTITFAVLLIIVVIGIAWASKQASDHQSMFTIDKDGNIKQTSMVPQERYRGGRRNGESRVSGHLIAGLTAFVIVGMMFAGLFTVMYGASDGLKYVPSLIHNVAIESDKSAYPGRVVGMDRREAATEPEEASSATPVKTTDVEVREYSRSFNRDLSHVLNPRVPLQEGDTVQVEVLTEAYNIKDNPPRKVQRFKVAGEVGEDGRYVLPLERIGYFAKHCPAKDKPFGALLYSIGRKGRLHLLGRGGTIVVGPARRGPFGALLNLISGIFRPGPRETALYLVLNIPQGDDFDKWVSGDIRMNVRVIRPNKG